MKMLLNFKSKHGDNIVIIVIIIRLLQPITELLLLYLLMPTIIYSINVSVLKKKKKKFLASVRREKGWQESTQSLLWWWSVSSREGISNSFSLISTIKTLTVWYVHYFKAKRAIIYISQFNCLILYSSCFMFNSLFDNDNILFLWGLH